MSDPVMENSRFLFEGHTDTVGGQDYNRTLSDRRAKAVVAQVGMAGLNRVWDGPDLLPDVAEIRDPQRWLARVHQQPPALPAVND